MKFIEGVANGSSGFPLFVDISGTMSSAFVLHIYGRF